MLSHSLYKTPLTYTNQSYEKATTTSASISLASTHHKQIVGTTLFSFWLHIKYGHRSLSALQNTVDKGENTGPGLPCKLASLPGRCPICDAAGMTRIMRGTPRDTTELPIRVMFHMDFFFFNIETIKGFNSALIIVERTSRYVWIFPTRCKSAPIDVCLYFFNQLIRRGLPCTHARTNNQ
jgi:hypothetical protein